MNDPLEYALRDTLASHANGRTPTINVSALLAVSRKGNRRRHAAVAAVAAGCIAAVGATVVPAVMTRHNATQTLAGQHPGQGDATDPGELARRLVAVLGDDAVIHGSGKRLSPGPMAATELGPELEGRLRTEGASATVTQVQESGGTWVISMTTHRLEPAASSEQARALASSGQADAGPLAEEQVGEGRLWVFPTAQGVRGVVWLPDGLLADVSVATGERPLPLARLTEAGTEVLRAAVRG